MVIGGEADQTHQRHYKVTRQVSARSENPAYIFLYCSPSFHCKFLSLLYFSFPSIHDLIQ